MNSINYIQGDATTPISSGVLLHVCNDIGLWGAGFVVALSKKYPETELKYLECYRKGYLKLGVCIPQVLSPELTVIHMIAQHGVRSKANPHPLYYSKLRECLKKINVRYKGSDFHMPKLGAGLAGGDWNKIAPMLESELEGNIFVYLLK